MIAREPRIDILRGFAILVILLNHLTQVVEFGGLRGGMIPTPTAYGYSTAAELFVLLSGYMVGLVYLARPHPIRAIWRRAATLWAYDLALLAIVVPLAFLMTPAETGFWRMDMFLSDPAPALLRFLTLQTAPRLLDILQLYILLMLVAPLAILIHRRSPARMIAVSILLYLAAQGLTILRLFAAPDGNADGLLNLLAWQSLFFVPMALGARTAHIALLQWLDGNARMLAVLVLLVLVAAVAKQLQADGILPQPDWMTGRYGLTPLRLGHALLMLLLYAGVLTAVRRILHRQPFRAIGHVGRHSLKCFLAGVVATYALGLFWARIGGGHPGYYLCAALATGLTLLLADRLSRRPSTAAQSRSTRSAGSASAAPPAGSA